VTVCNLWAIGLHADLNSVTKITALSQLIMFKLFIPLLYVITWEEFLIVRVIACTNIQNLLTVYESDVIIVVVSSLVLRVSGIDGRLLRA